MSGKRVDEAEVRAVELALGTERGYFDAHIAKRVQRIIADTFPGQHTPTEEGTMYDDTSRAARLTRRLQNAAEEFWFEETGNEAARLPMPPVPGRLRSFGHSPFAESEIYLVTVQHIETRVFHNSAMGPVTEEIPRQRRPIRDDPQA